MCSCLSILIFVFLIIVLSSILMCTHLVQCPYVYSYCPLSLCVLILSTILMCAHIVQYPCVCSYCPVSLLILSSILVRAHIVQCPYRPVCSYCPVSLLILSSILMCAHIVHYPCVHSYCPVSSCVLRVSSILRAQVGQFGLFPTGVMVAVYNSYETSAARWTYSSPFTALPCFSGDRHR